MTTTRMSTQRTLVPVTSSFSSRLGLCTRVRSVWTGDEDSSAGNTSARDRRSSCAEGTATRTSISDSASERPPASAASRTPRAVEPSQGAAHPIPGAELRTDTPLPPEAELMPRDESTAAGEVVLTERFVLPAEVLVVPLSELSPQAQRALRDPGEGDEAPTGEELERFAVGRPRSRRPQSVVDSETAALLLEFRQPSRLVDGVLSYSANRAADPREILEAAFPALERFVNQRLLMLESEARDEEALLRPSLAPGQLFQGYEVVRLVHLLEDVEVVQARSPDGELVALKLARGTEHDRGESRSAVDGDPLWADAVDKLAREAHCLKLLATELADVGRGAEEGESRDLSTPQLVEVELEGPRPYLAMQWCEGVSLGECAAQLRVLPRRQRLARQLELVRAVARAYARLHERGVIHSDVHPGNVIVQADGSVRVLDFGASRVVAPGCPWRQAPRAAVGTFFDPDLARDVLAGRVPRQADAQSDQYALAALLFLVVVGEPYLAFRAQQDELLHQVLEESPRSFAGCGVEPWPELEAVLQRALSKLPSERYSSVRELADVLARVRPPAETEPPDRPRWARDSRRLVDAMTERYGFESELLDRGLPRAPLASVAGGAAGVAWFLLQRAQQLDDPRLLSLAELWVSCAAAQWSQREEGFFAPDRGLTAERIGPGSVLHHSSGVFWVQAAVAVRRGDESSALEAVQRFVAAAPQPSESGEVPAELALGRAGLLIAAAELERLTATLELRTAREHCAQLLAGCRRQQVAALRTVVCSQAALDQCAEIPHFGMAHGWAGVLYALIRTRSWRAPGVEEAADDELVRCLRRRLDELADEARLGTDGACWPGTAPELRHLGATPDWAPGWCAGSAGHLLLLCESVTHRELRSTVDQTLLEQTARATWLHPGDHFDLCCGLAGRALALEGMAKVTGDKQWALRARTLIGRAVEAQSLHHAPSRPRGRATQPSAETGEAPTLDGLWKGTLGVALIASSLDEIGEGAEHQCGSVLPFGW